MLGIVFPEEDILLYLPGLPQWLAELERLKTLPDRKPDSAACAAQRHEYMQWYKSRIKLHVGLLIVDEATCAFRADPDFNISIAIDITKSTGNALLDFRICDLNIAFRLAPHGEKIPEYARELPLSKFTSLYFLPDSQTVFEKNQQFWSRMSERIRRIFSSAESNLQK